MDSNGHYEKLRQERFSSRREAFVTGNFRGIRFMNGKKEKNTLNQSLRMIEQEEIVKVADIEIQTLAGKLMSLELYGAPVYTQLPRERTILTDIEEDIIGKYFSGNLDTWNSYLTRLKNEYGCVHPIGVCFYISEMGFWDEISEPQNNNIHYTLPSRKELRKRIRDNAKKRKEEEKLKKVSCRKK